MKRIFLRDSPYTRQARFIAIVWTLLIFIGCFTPSNEIPQVSVPFIDKWTHLVLFGGFTFLWVCARPNYTASRLLFLLFIAIVMGCLIEVFQGLLTNLGRSMELMDAIADSIGSVLGIGLYMACRYFTKRQVNQ